MAFPSTLGSDAYKARTAYASSVFNVLISQKVSTKPANLPATLPTATSTDWREIRCMKLVPASGSEPGTGEGTRLGDTERWIVIGLNGAPSLAAIGMNMAKVSVQEWADIVTLVSGTEAGSVYIAVAPYNKSNGAAMSDCGMMMAITSISSNLLTTDLDVSSDDPWELNGFIALTSPELITVATS